MYLEASEAWCFAEELSNKIINGVWSDVVKRLKQLNPMQSIYVFDLIVKNKMLNQSNIDSLVRVISNHLNDKDE
jgi:hypothetical protein